MYRRVFVVALSVVLVSLVLVSFPQFPFFISKVRGAATVSYVLGTDLITCLDGIFGLGDIWGADVGAVDGRILKTSATSTTNGSMSLTRVVQPADDLAVIIKVVVSAVTGEVVFTLNGKDKDDVVQSEAITINAVTTYSTSKWFRSINSLGVVRSGFNSGESVTASITQNRWGEVWKVRDGLELQFKLDANLQVGDGSLYSGLVLVDVSLVMMDSKKITVKNNAFFQMGELLDEATRTVGYGASLFKLNSYPYGLVGEVGSNVSLYGAHVKGGSRSLGLYGVQNRLWHVLLDGAELMGDNLDVFDVVFVNCNTPLNPSTSSLAGTFDRLMLVGAVNVMARSKYMPQGVTLSNVYSRGHTYVVYDVPLGSYSMPDYTFIDADCDTWNHLQVSSSTAKIWVKSSYDLLVTYSNGTFASNVDVEISNPVEGVVYSGMTDEYGVIETQILILGFYNYTGGNIIYSSNPFILTVAKEGFLDYVTAFNVSAVRASWQIALTADTEVNEESLGNGFILGGLLFGIVSFASIIFFVKQRRRYEFSRE